MKLFMTIIQSTKHLKMIVSDSIDYTNIITGNFSLEYKKFDLEQILNELVGNMKTNLESKEIEIKLEYNLSYLL